MAPLSALGGAEAHSAEMAAAAGRMEGDAAAMAPEERYDCRLRLAPRGGERRCSGDGGGIPPTCASASRSIPIPPASPAEFARFSGDIGVVGTRHCAVEAFCAATGDDAPKSPDAALPRLPSPPAPPPPRPRPAPLGAFPSAAAFAAAAARAAWCAAFAVWCGCVLDPPTMIRPPSGPEGNPAGRSPWHAQNDSGTLTTRQSSACALASMISTFAMSGHRPRASRLNLITVNRYWSSFPYRFRSRLVLYSFPSSSASWCLRSSSGTRCVPVLSATTFVRRVFTLRSFRMLRPPRTRCVSAV